MKIKEFTETISLALQEGRVDGNTIYNAKLLNPISKNKRYYSQKAMSDVAKLSNGCRCFDSHDKRNSIGHIIGYWKNTRYISDSVTGDLHLLESSPMAKVLKEISEQNPSLASFSIAGKGQMANNKDADGNEIVESVLKIYSCDCVTLGATTDSVFESKDNPYDVVALAIENRELKAKLQMERNANQYLRLKLGGHHDKEVKKPKMTKEELREKFVKEMNELAKKGQL